MRIKIIHLGLPTGFYFEIIDPKLLLKLKMKKFPSSIPFTVKKSREREGGRRIGIYYYTLYPNPLTWKIL
jgi:hypothetical protein